MLYEEDSTFTDSVIYKETPKYITNTLDSTTTFKLENLKAGKYLMVALKDENNSNKYEQKADRIAYRKEFVTIPTEEIYDLKLFKEEANFKVTRPKQVAGNKIAFGYEGNAEKLKIKLHEKRPTGYTKRITKDPKADTLYYWYMPKIEADSLLFSVKNKAYQDSMYINIREMKKDTLVIKPIQSGTVRVDEDFEIEGSIPFKSINKENITLLDKDSLNVDFTIKLDSLQNRYVFNFDKKEDDNYKMRLLPDALTDLFENTNDTLNYNLRTKKTSDYGNVRITLYNAVYPVIVQLTDKQGLVVAEKYSEKSEPIDLLRINPGTYDIRVIYDTNKNRKWDTGNYLKKIQPERISYADKPIEVRANWDVPTDFTLK